MNITKLTTGDIEVALTRHELRGIRACLNEVCNGFRVVDSQRRIGVAENVALDLLGQTRPDSQKKTTVVGKDNFHLILTPMECQIFVNAMKATFRERKGEGILSSEYWTRIGSTMEEIKALVSQLEPDFSAN